MFDVFLVNIQFFYLCLKSSLSLSPFVASHTHTLLIFFRCIAITLASHSIIEGSLIDLKEFNTNCWMYWILSSLVFLIIVLLRIVYLSYILACFTRLLILLILLFHSLLISTSKRNATECTSYWSSCCDRVTSIAKLEVLVSTMNDLVRSLCK